MECSIRKWKTEDSTTLAAILNINQGVLQSCNTPSVSVLSDQSYEFISFSQLLF